MQRRRCGTSAPSKDVAAILTGIFDVLIEEKVPS
jgi:hypothetical protein